MGRGFTLSKDPTCKRYGVPGQICGERLYVTSFHKTSPNMLELWYSRVNLLGVVRKSHRANSTVFKRVFTECVYCNTFLGLNFI